MGMFFRRWIRTFAVIPASRHPRTGYTLFELIVVMAILILLAVVVFPSTSSLYGNSRPKVAGK